MKRIPKTHPSRVPKILLAWEAGDGRGHVLTLARVARALSSRACFEAALCRTEHSREIEPFCESVYRGAALRYDTRLRRAFGNPPAATLAEFLGDCGLSDAGFLARNIGWWLEVVRTRRIDAIVADFAPTALLAARIARIPVALVGVGYHVPPADLGTFPVLLPEYSRRIYAEEALLREVNLALSVHGGKPLSHLSEIFAATRTLACSPALLDPYADGRRRNVAPVTDVAPALAGDGEEIFAYLSTSEREDPVIVDALCALTPTSPVRVFAPGLSADRAEHLSRAGVLLEDRPVPIAEIARRSRLVFNAGQHGSLCMALLAGLPQVCVPRHLEQLYHAKRAAEAGLARLTHELKPTCEDVVETIRAAASDDAFTQRVRHRAQTLRAETRDLDEDIRSSLRALL